MIKVIEKGTERIFKKECQKCKSRLTYQMKDTKLDADERSYIICPECRVRNIVFFG